MKIGILTFHCAHNYGAVLQTYALQEVLKNLGHNPKIIDYRPSYLLKPYEPLNLKFSIRLKWMLKNSVVEMQMYPRRARRHRAFVKFIKSRLALSPYRKGMPVETDFDACVFGSDQIWNPLITGGYDDVFWGILPIEKGKKKFVSYAASMGRDVATDDERKLIRERLKNFDAISVREKSLQTLLAPLTDKEVNLVLDPTLLAPKTVWDKLNDNVKERGYVLVYQVREDPNTIEIARHIARQLNAEVICLEAVVKWKEGQEVRPCASPEDYVSYFKHARCVVTTSFHGTAFSVIFNKPFYCLGFGDWMDGRSKSLLQTLHLEERIIDKLDRPQFSDIDYSEANEILSRLRESSERFLVQNI